MPPGTVGVVGGTKAGLAKTGVGDGVAEFAGAGVRFGTGVKSEAGSARRTLGDGSGDGPWAGVFIADANARTPRLAIQSNLRSNIIQMTQARGVYHVTCSCQASPLAAGASLRKLPGNFALQS